MRQGDVLVHNNMGQSSNNHCSAITNLLAGRPRAPNTKQGKQGPQTDTRTHRTNLQRALQRVLSNPAEKAV